MKAHLLKKSLDEFRADLVKRGIKCVRQAGLQPPPSKIATISGVNPAPQPITYLFSAVEFNEADMTGAKAFYICTISPKSNEEFVRLRERIDRMEVVDGINLKPGIFQLGSYDLQVLEQMEERQRESSPQVEAMPADEDPEPATPENVIDLSGRFPS